MMPDCRIAVSIFPSHSAEWMLLQAYCLKTVRIKFQEGSWNEYLKSLCLPRILCGEIDSR